ncbi:hypothetical protein [Xenorhabdus eapokensis]|uniref:hypothetical protein n=1 Tax=Xenorhabdus eapokensis TaxID=1873482 RepID=UPI000A6CA398|nr:hypothetical protein [Xenorhabdus eapokensis]
MLVKAWKAALRIYWDLRGLNRRYKGGLNLSALQSREQSEPIGTKRNVTAGA